VIGQFLTLISLIHTAIAHCRQRSSLQWLRSVVYCEYCK